MKTTTAVRIGAVASALLLFGTLALYLVLRPTGACACVPEDRTSQDRIDARAYYDEFESADDEDGGIWGGLGGRRTAGSQNSAPDSSGAAESAGPDGQSVPPATGLPPRPQPRPGLDDGNVYVDAGTHGFVSPAERPSSTFGLDVDTGSFSIARTRLETGRRPDPASIRPEEWVNAFTYDDPAPTDKDLGLTTESADLPGSGQSSLVRVGVTSREVDRSERPPAAVTFLVDTSSSMNIRERLGLAKSSLALLAKNLRPTDTISIVTYSDTARAVLPPTPVSRTSTILDAIDDLESNGSTNLEDGLDLAYEQAREGFREGGINTVVLASDGVANVGATNPDALARKIRTAADDVNLVSVGFGMGNYNDDLMEQLADQGQGFYGYVDTYAEAERLFVEQLTSTMTVVASDAKAQATFDPEKVESYRLVGYENRALADEDFSDASVDAGEIGSGHQVTALYEVRLADGVEDGSVIGKMSARWKTGRYGDGKAGRSAETSTELEAPTSGTRPSYDLRLTSLTARFAQALKSAGTGEQPALAELQREADRLAEGGAHQAEELAAMIGQARSAQPVTEEPMPLH